ncbi:hypothetical protein H4R33_005389 [Dimargaris cristalligena]|nr:hypothetical protein H4R33_005389 [Dimargaris cristalligena]
MWYDSLLDSGYLPDRVIRVGIRQLLQSRIRELYHDDEEKKFEYKMNFINDLKAMPIAISMEKANDQHYEVPAEFMALFMGSNMKYSCGLFADGVDTIEEAENRMLEVYCERARIQDGLDILDLGSGWGSLTLFIAKAQFVEEQSRKLGVTNIETVTGDIVDYEWESERKFHRIVTIEMIEHMKNYELLFAKLSRWLYPDGLLFAETLSHREVPYHFNVDDDHSWMARHFFTGGCMPSRDLYLYFQSHLRMVDQWYHNGTHFHRTSECWLRNLDRHRDQALPVLARIYAPLVGADPQSARGEQIARKWFQRWRIYNMACSEMFAYGNFQEWGITHHLLQNRGFEAAVKYG